MSPRLPKDEREQIHESKHINNLSVRVEARKLKVSPSTIQRWRHRKDFDDHQRRKGTKAVSCADDILFRELLRLTRYSYKQLILYLSPLKAGGWDNPSYYHYLYMDEAQPLKPLDQNSPVRYACATHSIRVSWVDTSGKVIKGKILFFFDRHSGLLYAKAYKTRIPSHNFARALSRFERMLPRDITSLHFVSSPSTGLPENNAPVITSTLYLESAPGDRSKLSENSLARLDECVCWADGIGIPLIVDPSTQQQQERLTIPGQYESRVALDRYLERLCNILNLKKRTHHHRRAIIKTAPVDKLATGILGASRKKLARGIRLPRDIKYKYQD